MIEGQIEWAHALAGGLSVWVAEGSNGDSHLCLERGGKKRTKTITKTIIYDLDILNHSSPAAGSRTHLLPHCG